jgi:hypothetical protein
MAITKEINLIKTEIVTDYKIIQVLKEIIVKENGTVISKSNLREIIEPDISSEKLALQDTEIQNIANSIWNEQIKNAWIAKKAKDLEEANKPFIS